MAVHLHGVQGVADLAGGGVDGGGAVGAVVGVGGQQVVGGVAVPDQTLGLHGADTGQLAVGTEHVIGQNGDIHGQTVVHHDGIGQGLDLPDDCEPDHGVGVVVAIAAGVQAVGVSRAVAAVILHDIGGRGVLGLGDLPVAGVIGVDGDLISCAGIVQLITLGQDLVRQDVGLNVRSAVQGDGLVQHGVGDGDLVGEGAGGAGGLVDHDLTVLVDQIEGVGNVGLLPGQDGGNGILVGGVVQIVVVVEVCVVVGGVGTGLAGTLHGAGQVDIVAQGQLGGLDGAHAPVEGLAGQDIGGAGGQIVLIHAGGDIQTFDGNTLVGGVVVEVLGTDDAVGTQDVGTLADDAGVRTGDGVDLLAVLGLPVELEDDGLQDLVGALTVADLVLGALAALVVGTGEDVVLDDLDLGVLRLIGNQSATIAHRIAIQVDQRLHLQIVVLTHLVHVAGVVGRVVDCSGNAIEGMVQFIRLGNLIVVLGTAIVVRSGGCQSLVDAVDRNLAILLCIEVDGEHLGTQTGDGVEVVLTGGDQGSLRQTCGALTDDLITLVGIALDGVGHTVLVELTVAIMVVQVIEVAVVGAVQVAGGQIGSLPGTGQPVVPLGIGILGTEVVPLQGCTVGHEDDIQITFLGVLGLDGGAELIDGIESIVIVGAGGVVQGVGSSQVAGRHESTCIQCLAAGVNLCLGGLIVTGAVAIAVLHIVTLGTVVGSAAGTAGTITIVAIEVGDGDTGIHGLILEECNQAFQRLLQNRGTGLIGAGNIVLGHGRRGIQHDDNICTLLHGHAGGGDLHAGDAGGLEVDAGAGLADLNGTLVGVFGIVVALVVLDGGLAGSSRLDLGGSICLEFALHGLAHSVIAAVNAVGIVGGVDDLVLIDLDSQRGALTGGAGGGAGIHVTCADVGEVQGLGLCGQIHAGQVAAQNVIVPAPVVCGCDGHGLALGVVVVAGLVIGMVVTEEVGNIHFSRDRIDGIEPILGPCIVVAVVEQGLVAHDEQGLALVQVSHGGLERSNGLGDSGSEAAGDAFGIVGLAVSKAGVVAVVGAQVAHAQVVDIVVVINHQGALLADGRSGPVMVGPGVVHGNIGENLPNVAVELVRVAGDCALVGREHITCAVDGSDGSANIGFDLVQHCLQGGCLVVFIGAGSTNVQIAENNEGINGSFGCIRCKCADRQEAQQHHKAQQEGYKPFHVVHFSLPP